MDTTWWIFRGTNTPHDDIKRLPPPPPWRRFPNFRMQELPLDVQTIPPGDERGKTYQVSESELALINAAITLRRPLLVTGQPGTGKSTLAYAIAYELMLGPVLPWQITTRTTLGDGL